MEMNHPKITVIGFGLDACSAMADIILEDKLDIKPVAVDAEIEIDRTTGERHIWSSQGFSVGLETSEGLIFKRTLRREKIEEISSISDLVFILVNMGESGVPDTIHKAKWIASACKSLTVGIFGLPDPRIDIDIAECMQELKEPLDAWITVPYNPLLNEPEVRRMEKNIFRYGIKGITELVTIPGEINIDISDLQTTLENAGPTYMSIGTGYGESGCTDAAKDALRNNFLDVSSPRGARNVLFRVIGRDPLTFYMVNEAADIVQRHMADEANIVFGVSINPDFEQTTKIILVATDICS